MIGFLQTWFLFDKFYYQFSRLEFVNQKEQNIFRVRLLVYHGDEISLSDGTQVKNKDRLLKIHLHNCQLLNEMQQIKNDVKRAYYVYQRVERSLPGLAQYVQEHPEREKIKALLGITLLNRGVQRLGFETVEIKNPFYRRFKESYLIPMFIFCHPNLNKNSFHREKLKPKYLVMSKDRLLRDYLSLSGNYSCVMNDECMETSLGEFQ